MLLPEAAAGVVAAILPRREAAVAAVPLDLIAVVAAAAVRVAAVVADVRADADKKMRE